MRLMNNVRRVCIAVILTTVGGLFSVPRTLIAQVEGKDQDSKGQVVLSKLFPPVFPPLARQAMVFGDVHLKVSIRPDGSINSVEVIDGSPVFREAVLESARKSQFDCKDCGPSDLVERTFTYSFQPSSDQKAPDSSCCLEEQGPLDNATTVRVSQSDDRITITPPARCICSPEYLGTLLDRRMRLIAGNNALDCGRVKIDGDPKASLKCAHQAIKNKRAFVLRLDSFGIDSFLSDGFAGDGSGNVYSVAFDSLGYGPSRGVKIMDNGHDAVQICPKPVRIRKEVSSKGAFMGYHCTPQI